MTQYEVYVACKDRSSTEANRFLDAFLPKRREVADEYPLPETSDTPRDVFGDAASLIRRLEEDSSEEYAIYWDREGSGDPHQAMLFFTEDGGMIAGLASANPDSLKLLRELANAVGATYGLVVLEERPAGTLGEFRDLCRTTPTNRLVDGEFLLERPPDS